MNRLKMKAASLYLYLFMVTAALVTGGFQFHADEWVTECHIGDPSGDCSIIGVFRGTSRGGTTKGSFSLAIDLQSAQVALVGTPPPTKASIRVDKHPPMECAGVRYCLMSSRDSEVVIRQLKTGTLILLDVSTAKDVFFLSMTTKGYRAGLSKILAHRDLLR